MPFQSEPQRRFMWANHPRIAHAWAHGRSSVTGKRETSRQRGRPKSRRSSRG